MQKKPFTKNRNPFPMYMYSGKHAILIQDQDEEKLALKDGFSYAPTDERKKPAGKAK